jgi:hypothetical protein
MIAKVPLLNDRAAAMAVDTPDRALADLTLEHRDGHLSPSQLNDPGSLRADVIEIQHDRILLSAVHAGLFSKALQEEQEVASPKRPHADRGAPLRIHSPGSDPPACAPTVAVSAHELTVGKFSLDPVEPVSLSDELADFHPLGPDMIELQDGGIRQSAVRTLA